MKKNLIILTALVLVIFICSCNTINIDMQRGSGNVVSEERTVESFDEIRVEGAGELILTQADEFSLTVEAEDNIISEVVTRNEGDTLVISFTDQRWRKSYIPTEPIRFYISMPDLKELYITGAAKVEMETLQTSALTLRTDGAADIRMENLQLKSLTIELNGGAQFDLSGKAEKQEINIDGAGSCDAADLETQETTISIAGAAEAMVWATERLDVDIAGAGSVRYYGSPHVTQNIDGISSVRSLGEH